MLGTRRKTPDIIKWLIGINIAVFLLQVISYSMAEGKFDPIIEWFALHPIDVIENGALWQLITHQFLHSPTFILHIGFNMFLLWMFGGRLVRVWGQKGFMQYYLICGIAGGIGMILFNYQGPPSLGASGAVMGLFGAWAIYWPDQEVLLWGVFPIKIKYLVMIAGAAELWMGVSGTGGNIANMAHSAGLIAGLVYAWRGNPKNAWLFYPYTSIKKYVKKRKKKRAKKKKQRKKRKQKKRQEMIDRADEILDEINKKGWENLSDEKKREISHISEVLEDDPDAPDIL